MAVTQSAMRPATNTSVAIPAMKGTLYVGTVDVSVGNEATVDLEDARSSECAVGGRALVVTDFGYLACNAGVQVC
jgi:hypothetical protein